MKASDKTNEHMITDVEHVPRRIPQLERSSSKLKEFRESREDLEAIFNDVRDGIILLDLTGKIVKINKRITETTGYTEKDIVGKLFKFLKIFTADSMSKMITAFAKTMAGQQSPPYEVEGYIKTGEKWIAEIHSSQLKKGGKIVGAIAVIRDITERKKMEEELREREEKYRELINGMNDTAWVIDFNGNFIDVNDAAIEVLGYSREELLAMRPYDIDATLDADEISGLIKGMPKDKLQVFETTHTTKDGKTIPVEIKSSLVTYQGQQAILSIARDITDRKRAEEALRESEARYRSLVDNIDLGINLIDIDHNIIMVNCTQSRHLNKPLSQTIGKKCFRAFEKRDAVCPHCPAVKTIATDQSAETEIEVTGDDGKLSSLRIQTFPVFGQDGTVTAFIEVVEDITKRKRMEEALRESEEEFRTFMETASDLMHITDKDFNYTYVNEAMARTLGYSKKEMIGMNIAHVVKEEAVKNDFKRNLEALKKHGEISFETIRVAKDGTEINGELKLVGIFDKDGAFAGTRGVFRDITERKKMEENLRTSEERFRRVVETMKVGLGAIDENAVLTYVNEYFANMLGYSIDEMIGRSTLDFHDEESHKIQEEIFKKRRAGGRDSTPYELTWRKKDGQKVYAILSPTPMFDKDGRYMGSFAIHTDITERKKAEAELRESEERHRTLFEHAGFAIELIEAETGKRIAFNAAAHKNLGYTREEFQEVPAADLTVHKDPKQTLQRFKRITEKGSDLYEIQLEAKNGEIRDMLISAVPIRIKEKDCTHIIRVDITDQKRAEEDRKESFERLKRSLESTVSALASAFEVRDPYTAGHQQRVTDLACAIAEEMGLSEEQIDGIRMAGLIHDIGKINIPAEILNKPGQLTEIEYSLFKNHPQVGHDVLQTVEFPWPVAQIVLQHHERMDGSGYPQGLSGDEIMLEARILAVADIVEAIASHRPYRPARGAGDALEEILHNKGTLYDPEVVDACLRVFYEKGFKFEHVLQVATLPRIH